MSRSSTTGTLRDQKPMTTGKLMSKRVGERIKKLLKDMLQRTFLRLTSGTWIALLTLCLFFLLVNQVILRSCMLAMVLVLGLACYLTLKPNKDDTT